MNTKKRKSQVSSRRHQGGVNKFAGLCTVLHDYEKNYGQNLFKSTQSQDPKKVSKTSKSPSQKQLAAAKVQPQPHPNGSTEDLQKHMIIFDEQAQAPPPRSFKLAQGQSFGIESEVVSRIGYGHMAQQTAHENAVDWLALNGQNNWAEKEGPREAWASQESRGSIDGRRGSGKSRSKYLNPKDGETEKCRREGDAVKAGVRKSMIVVECDQMEYNGRELGDGSDGSREFCAKKSKSSVKERLFGVKCQDLDDSLAQYNSNLSLKKSEQSKETHGFDQSAHTIKNSKKMKGEDDVMLITDNHCFNRHGNSPSKSLKKMKKLQDCEGNEMRTLNLQHHKVSTSSTVIYDSHVSSVQTPLHLQKKGLERKNESPLHKNNLVSQQYKTTNLNQNVQASQCKQSREEAQKLNPEILFSFNQSTSKDQVDKQNDGSNNIKNIKGQFKTVAQDPTRSSLSPKRHLPAEYYFGSVQEKAKNQKQWKMMDILNYGRAKRDEILERLQVETTKKFNELNKSRAKSSGNLSKAQNHNFKSKKPYKLQKEPMILEIHEQDLTQNPIQRRSPKRCTTAFKNDSLVQTHTNRLYAPTKSSQAKLDPCLRQPPNNYGSTINPKKPQNPTTKPQPTPQIPSKLLPSASLGSNLLHTIAATPKSKSTKPSRGQQAEDNRGAGRQMGHADRGSKDSLKETGTRVRRQADANRSTSLRKGRDEEVERYCVAPLHLRQGQTRSQGKHQGRKSRKAKQNGFNSNNLVLLKMTRSRSSTLGSTRNQKSAAKTPIQNDKKTIPNDLSNKMGKLIHRNFSKGAIANSQASSHQRKNLNSTNESKLQECDSSTKFKDGSHLRHNNQKKNTIRQSNLETEKQKCTVLKPSKEENTLNHQTEKLANKSPIDIIRESMTSDKHCDKHKVTKSPKKGQHTQYAPANMNRTKLYKHQIKSFSDSELIQFIKDKLLAVMLGYKTRTIYRVNRKVKQYRQEYRDLIQFAFSLKQEMSAIEGVRGQETQYEITKQLLFQSLKDLIHKKQQFSKCFNKIFNSGTQWLDPQHNRIQTTSNTEETNPTFRSPQKGRNSQKNQLRSGASVGPQSTQNIVLSFSPGKKDPIVQDPKLKKDSSSATRNFTQNSLVFKNSSFSYNKTGNSLKFSNQSQSQQIGDGTLGLSSSKIYTSEKTILKRQGTFHQSQMTFGTNNISSSIEKNEKSQESESKTRSKPADKLKQTKPSASPKKRDLSQVSEEINAQNKQPEKKHTFLKRGEKTRKVYDPQRAIQMENMAKRKASQSLLVSQVEPHERAAGSPFKQGRNKSTSPSPRDIKELTYGSNQKLKQIMSRVSVPVESQKTCLTPTKQQPKHVFSRFQTVMKEEQTVEKLNRTPATPKSQDSHMKRMKQIRETYQSPYKQLVNQSSGIKESQIDQKNKNFVEINRERVASMATDSRKMSVVSSTHCHRNPILDNTIKSFHTQIKSQKGIDSNENGADQINNRRDSQSSQNQFVSKIPRLTCSISRERGSIPRDKCNQSPQKSPQKITYQSQTSDPVQPPQTSNIPRGSFTNCHRSSFHQNPAPQPSEQLPTYPNYQSSPSSLHPSSPCVPHQATKSPAAPQAQQRMGQVSSSHKGHQNCSQGASGVPPAAPVQTRGASSKQSQMRKKTPSLMEMNEKIKMQNQIYIQKQLCKGQGMPGNEDSSTKQTKHKSFVSQQRASLNVPFNYSKKITSIAAVSQNDLNNSSEKIRETAMECVRKSRENSSAMSIGRRPKHSPEKNTLLRDLNYSKDIVSENVAQISQLGVQATGKAILQLNTNNLNQKASLRYQNPKAMSDISGLSQPTSALDKRSNSGLGCQNQLKGDKSNGHYSPSRPIGCDIQAFQQLIGERLARNPNDSRSSIIDQKYDKNSFGKQDELSSSNAYHTNGTSHLPECSSPPHKPLETKYRSSPDYNESKPHHHRVLGSRLPGHDSSEKDSIIHQASNLQHILDKFSPLRSASQENNNFQRRKSFNYKTKHAIISNNDCQQQVLDQCPLQTSVRKIDRLKMQVVNEDKAVCDQDMKSSERADASTIPLKYQIEMQQPDQLDNVYDAKGFQSLQIPADDSDDTNLQKKRSIPCHNINHSIGMFNMKNKCLDLGRSSNFDSLTNSNLPSYRMVNSPKEKHRRDQESSQNECDEIVSIPTVTINGCDTGVDKFKVRKSSIMEITNSYIDTEKHHRNQTTLNVANSNQDTTKATWYHHPIGSQVFKTPSICSTSTFHLCPQSIKNKTSSMSSSFQASSRQSAMASVRQNDPKPSDAAVSHPHEAKTIRFNYQHITAPRVDGIQQTTVLYQEKQAERAADSSPHRRVKYSPQNRGYKPVQALKQSPQKKMDKENRVTAYDTDLFTQTVVATHNNSQDTDLIMPQIIAGTTNNPKSRQPGALRNQIASDLAHPAVTSSTFSRRRRSKAERSSKQGVRSRRQGCEEAAGIMEVARGERGMLRDIGNTEESAGTAEKRSGNEMNCADEMLYNQHHQSSHYKSRERAQESPSFSPRKANQFSSLTTPANKRKQQSQAKFDLKQFSAQGGTSGETSVKRQRLTQTKRSRECQAMQSNGSP